jgi:hypothetical protein
MDQPIWLLVPWLVFAIAAVLKAWKIGRLVNRQLRSKQGSTARGLEHFRAELELGWQRNHQSGQDKYLS